MHFLLISASFVLCFKVPLFRIVAESINKNCNLYLTLKISKSEVSYEDDRGNVFHWSVRFMRMWCKCAAVNRYRTTEYAAQNPKLFVLYFIKMRHVL